VGTIWFDDCSAEDRVVAYLRSEELGLDRRTTSFLDLGTGNGHFLFRLREGEEEEDDDDDHDAGAREEGDLGFLGPMLGVDYSTKSVEFANTLSQDMITNPDSEPPPGPLEFLQYDILTSPPSSILQRLLNHNGSESPGYDVVLDKGTFDAISLSGDFSPDGRRVFEGYRDRVLPLVRDAGLLLVVSCNWTEEELIDWFIGSDEAIEGARFEVHGRVPFGSFTFGGKKGQSINCVCFKKLEGIAT